MTDSRMPLLLTLALSLAAAVPLRAQDTATPASLPPPSAPILRHVARGVDLVQETLNYGPTNGPHIVTAIEVDPRTPGVHLEAALAQNRATGREIAFGREPVSHLTAREKAVAGVNAGFFSFDGFPVDLHIQDGDLVTYPETDCVSFYILNDGTSGFGHFTASGAVTAADGATSPLEGFNHVPTLKNQTLILFTPRFGPHTLARANRYEVTLAGLDGGPLKPGRTYTGTVAATGDGGGMAIPASGVVLSGAGPAADFLRAAAARSGARLSFRVNLQGTTDGPNAAPIDVANIAQAASGRVMVVRNGRVTPQALAQGAFATTPHPRTAVGRTADGHILLVTVDGRQKGVSEGAPLPDLARVLISLGATDALNLDGGGSSDAVAWDTVLNAPSDGSERSVADMLAVFAPDLPAEKRVARPARLLPPPHPLQVGETWDFGTPSGLGANPEAVWGTTGTRHVIGFVSQMGVFHALRPGKGTVTVTLGGRSRRAVVPVEVQGAGGIDSAEFTAALTLKPDPADPAKRAILTIKVANADGDPLGEEPVNLTVVGGQADPPTVTTDRRGTAQATITWDANAPTRSVDVVSPRKRFRGGSVVAP